MGEKLTLSILIPAYNEEKTIKKTVDSCLNQSEKADQIIVVNDGSKDKTLKILETYGNKIKIIDLSKNTGNKSKAQEQGLKTVKTDLFVTADADTKLHVDFVKQIKKTFREQPEYSAICGFVESERVNWITSVREINYLTGQTIYKQAQAHINAVFVLAGCASAFRTKDFRETVTFDHDNITEDLDFTYKLKIAGKKIFFNNRAIVYTQDPNTLNSYYRQLYRWYSGSWTCLKKNFAIMAQPNNALILSLLYLEGLIMGMFFLLSPLFILYSLNFFLGLILLHIVVVAASSAYGIIKFKRPELFLYLPHQYILGVGEQIVFIYTFFKEFVFNNKNMVWYKPERY
ncbi:MAG: glycosyltransferase family 2 protein [archaeon]